MGRETKPASDVAPSRSIEVLDCEPNPASARWESQSEGARLILAFVAMVAVGTAYMAFSGAVSAYQGEAPAWVNPRTGNVGYRPGTCKVRMPAAKAELPDVASAILERVLVSVTTGPISCHPAFAFYRKVSEFGVSDPNYPAIPGTDHNLVGFPFVASGVVTAIGDETTELVDDPSTTGVKEKDKYAYLPIDFEFTLIDGTTFGYRLELFRAVGSKPDKRWSELAPATVLSDPYGSGVLVNLDEARPGACLATQGTPPDDASGIDTTLAVLLVPCDSPHGYVFRGSTELTGSKRYPGKAALQEQAETFCLSLPGEPGPINIFWPARESWNNGDRLASCVVPN